MLTFCRTKKIAINCRCGKRTIWHLSEELKHCIDTEQPLSMERTGEGMQTIVPVMNCYFVCECGRTFEYSKEGLRNVTEHTDCGDMMKMYLNANHGGTIGNA